MIDVQSSTDAANWVTQHSITPTDNAPIVAMFPEMCPARYWRLSINAGTNATYGSSIPGWCDLLWRLLAISVVAGGWNITAIHVAEYGLYHQHLRAATGWVAPCDVLASQAVTHLKA